MAQKEQAGGVGVGFAMGLLIGAVIGILYAPRSGKDTREIIKEKTEVTKEKAEQIIEEAKQKAETIVETAREKAAEMKQKRDRSGEAETPG